MTSTTKHETKHKVSNKNVPYHIEWQTNKSKQVHKHCRTIHFTLKYKNYIFKMTYTLTYNTKTLL